MSCRLLKNQLHGSTPAASLYLRVAELCDSFRTVAAAACLHAKVIAIHRMNAVLP
jgi:hypothetical protein